MPVTDHSYESQSADMRLLDVGTFEFFERTNNEPYAILSHTWDEKEFTYSDMIRFQEKVATWSSHDRKSSMNHSSQPGAAKVRRACRSAETQGFRYIWIDTCCINKENPSELSRAIRSMFRWYERAAVCLVHLSDVGFTLPGDVSFKDTSRWPNKGLPKWFTRGWTYQELLAPKDVSFYNAEWVFIGSKRSLWSQINEATKIPKEALLKDRSLKQYSAAQKLSWAAGRQTKEEEDIAYSLIGIFDVTLQLDYGEGGEKAFHRLQRAILAETDDMSIFAWSMPPSRLSLQSLAPYDISEDENLFAPCTAVFAPCGQTESIVDSGNRTIVAAANKLHVAGTARLRFVHLPKSYNRSRRYFREPADWRNLETHKTTRYVMFVGSTTLNDELYSVGLCMTKVSERMFKRDFEAPVVYMKSAAAIFVELEEYYIAIRGPYPRFSHDVLSLRNKDSVAIVDAWPPDRWDHSRGVLFEPPSKLHISWAHIVVSIEKQIFPLIVLCDHRSQAHLLCTLICPTANPQILSALRRAQPSRRVEEQTWEELEALIPEVKDLKCVSLTIDGTKTQLSPVILSDTTLQIIRVVQHEHSQVRDSAVDGGLSAPGKRRSLGGLVGNRYSRFLHSALMVTNHPRRSTRPL